MDVGAFMGYGALYGSPPLQRLQTYPNSPTDGSANVGWATLAAVRQGEIAYHPEYPPIIAKKHDRSFFCPSPKHGTRRGQTYNPN